MADWGSVSPKDISGAHFFYFFISLIFLGLTHPPIFRTIPDPAEIESPKLWMKTTFTRRIMKSTTKSQNMKMQQRTIKLFRKNKRPFWTPKFSVFSTKESESPRTTQQRSSRMETTLRGTRTGERPERWNSRTVMKIKRKSSRIKILRGKRTKTTNSFWSNSREKATWGQNGWQGTKFTRTWESSWPQQW